MKAGMTMEFRIGRPALLAVLFIAAPTQAAVKLTPFASITQERDDNLFRTEQSKQSEDIRAYAAGLDFNYSAGLQNFFLNGSANKTEYDRFSQLDYDGNDVSAGMNWKLGSVLDGDLRLGRTRSLQDFASQNAGTDRNITESTRGSASVGVRILSNYELRARPGGSRFRNSSPTQRLQDLDEVTVGLSVSRIGVSGSIGVEAVLGDGEYIERDPGVGVIEEYDQSTIQLIGTWKPSPITSFSSSAGWTKRDNLGTEVTDDDGFVGALSASRSVSVKTTVYAGLSRTLTSSDQQGESTVQGTNANTGATWQATPKVSVNGSYYFTRNDFRRATADAADRQDDYQGVSFGLSYTPLEWLVLKPAANWESRSSDESDDYDDYRVSLEIQVRYPLVR